MPQGNKEYAKAFLIEPTKLERLLEVVHERLGDHPDTTIQDRFEVFMAGNRAEVLSTVEDVLALENSKKYRIERLLITSVAANSSTGRIDSRIRVDFGVIKHPKSNTTGGTSKFVTVAVMGDTLPWTRQTLSQVEEQVERTWISFVTPVVSLLSLVILLLVFFLILVLPRLGDEPWKTMWLDDPQLDRIEQAVKENGPLTEAEMRDIGAGQYQNVLAHLRPKAEPQVRRKRTLLLFGIPFLLIVAVSVYLALTCYPKTVFLWGDEVDRYNATLLRRKVLWGHYCDNSSRWYRHQAFV